MLSTIRPIIFKLTGLTDSANGYLAYTLSVGHASDYVGGVTSVQIYTGKAFVDANGNTDIRVDQVLKDYLWQWATAYTVGTQTRRPACFCTLADQHYSIEEEGNDFYNAIVTLAYTYGGSEHTETANVCGAWVPPYLKMAGIYDPMTDAGLANGIQNYATLATDILPELPPISTANFWLGLVLNVNKALTDANYALYIGASAFDMVDISYGIHYAGTYAKAYSLQELIANLVGIELDGGESDSVFQETVVDGGYSDSAFDYTLDGGDSYEPYHPVANLVNAPIYLYWVVDGVTYSTKVAQFDKCPARYYVSWILPTGGWASVAMDGNVTVGTNNTPTQITNFYDEAEVLSMREQPTFNLFRGNAGKDMYAHLLTMLSSKHIYVYDTEQDRGWYCTPDTASGSTLPTKTGKMQHFNVQLKAISANEQ